MADRTRQDFFAYLGTKYSFHTDRRYTYGYELETPKAPLFRSIIALKDALRGGGTPEILAAHQLAIEENGADLVETWLTDAQQILLAHSKVA